MSFRVRTLVLVLCAALIALALPSAVAAKKAPRGFFGVVSQAPLNSADWAHMKRGDVGSLRIPLIWASVQQVQGRCRPKPRVGVCNWTDMDAIVGAAAQARVRVMPILAGPPSFVSKDPKRMPIKGKDKRRWKAFLRSAADRYGRKGVFWKSHPGKSRAIKDWQVWNEPNSKQGARGNKPRPRKYAKLVKHSSKAINKGDRKADIVLGGMFADSRLPLRKFMKRLYKQKRIKRHFDELALHPYAPKVKHLKRQLRQARKALRNGNDRKAKIAVTEMGYSSKNGKHALMQGRKGQAKMLRKTFRVLKNKRKQWKISTVNWFALQDTTNRDTCRFCRNSGLFTVNGAPKRSWAQFKKFSR